MIKVVAACGNGMGSSQIIKMKIDKVFKKMGIQATIDHMSVGEARSAVSSYDVVFCSASLIDNFSCKNSRTKIVGLVNLLSEVEIEAKIKENNIL
jgi:PTS system ascorbate-specific IIB component